MSEDWLKIDKKTPDKPEVAIIAAALQLDIDSVLGKLIRIWSWFDSNTTDGVTNVTVRPLLDRIAGVIGFTSVMEMAGWILETEDGRLMIPNFDRYMGKSAKTRALTASRVAKSRAKKAAEASGNAPSVTDVTHAPLPKALPDRDREIEGTHTHTAGAGGSEDGQGAGADRIPSPGFPTRQQVLDYATSQGWDLREAVAFWLHHDDKRSQGEPYAAHWHWWSKLEKWMLDNQWRGMSHVGAKGGKGAAKRTTGNGGPSTPADWGTGHTSRSSETTHQATA